MFLNNIAPVAGNVFLVILFIKALLNPAENKDFIENTSFFYFLTEMLTLAASLVLIKFRLHPIDLGIKSGNLTLYDMLVKKLQYFSIVCFFSIGPFLVGYITHNLFFPLLFFVSLVAKAYSHNLANKEKNLIIYSIIFGLSYFFLVTGTILWGIVYYGSLSVYESYNSFRYYKKIPRK